MGASFLIPDADRISPTSTKLPSAEEMNRLDQIIKELPFDDDPSSIDYQKLLLHLDQPYATELLERMVKTHPDEVALVADMLPGAAKQHCQRLLAEAIPLRDAESRVHQFYLYKDLPNAEEIRQEAIEELIRTNPVQALREPSLLKAADNFEERYLECYNRASPVERSAIFSDSNSENLSITDAMRKEAFPVALLNDPLAIGLNPEWLEKQSWFKEIDFDFDQLANHADPKVGVAAMELLQKAGVEVPEEALLLMAQRCASTEPLSILKLLDISHIDESTSRPFNTQALDALTNTEPIEALRWLNVGLGKDLTQEERKHYVTQAAETALVKEPTELLSWLPTEAFESFSDQEKAALQSKAIIQAKQSDAENFIKVAAYYAKVENDETLFFDTARSLGNSNPKALLQAAEYFSGLTHIEQSLYLFPAIAAVAENDPKAVFDFRNANKTLEVTQSLFTSQEIKEALIQGCLEKSPATLFLNMFILKDSPNRDALLMEAASRMSITDRLRYTGLSKCDNPPTAAQQAQIRANANAVESWISNPHYPDYSNVYQDKGLVRSLRIHPSWVEHHEKSPEARNDLRLSIGRNLYFQSKEVNEENVAQEMENISNLRNQYGDVALFKDRNVILASGNELKPDATLRFAQEDLIETLRKESKNFTHIIPPTGAKSAEQEKEEILGQIRNSPEPITLMLNGHGEEFDFYLTEDATVATYELARAFSVRAENRAYKAIAEPDIIIFNQCFGQDATRSFYNYLQIDNGKDFPIVIGQAEVGQFGYSDFDSSFGDSFLQKVLGLEQLVNSQRDGSGFRPTINTVIEQQYQYSLGNSFVYAPAKTAPFLQIGALEVLKLPEVNRQA